MVFCVIYILLSAREKLRTGYNRAVNFFFLYSFFFIRRVYLYHIARTTHCYSGQNSVVVILLPSVHTNIMHYNTSRYRNGTCPPTCNINRARPILIIIVIIISDYPTTPVRTLINTTANLPPSSIRHLRPIYVRSAEFISTETNASPEGR